MTYVYFLLSNFLGLLLFPKVTSNALGLRLSFAYSS
jgi:hypothetical protein